MKGVITKNFRGLRALVIQQDDANRRVLISVLGKLGLTVQVLGPQDVTEQDLPACDVIFVDADVGIEVLPQGGTLPRVPSIALIGTEAPSRLARVVRQRCTSHIQKPIGSSGVFTALLLAVNEHEQRQKTDREIETLRQRLAGRRVVTKAVLELMAEHGIDQDEAYDQLRVAAMNRRMPIDEMAREHLAAEFGARSSLRSSRAKPDDQNKKHANNRRLTP